MMLLSSLIAYNTTKEIGTLGTLVAGASGLIGIWGTWVVRPKEPILCARKLIPLT